MKVTNSKYKRDAFYTCAVTYNHEGHYVSRIDGVCAEAIRNSDVAYAEVYYKMRESWMTEEQIIEWFNIWKPLFVSDESTVTFVDAKEVKAAFNPVNLFNYSITKDDGTMIRYLIKHHEDKRFGRKTRLAFLSMVRWCLIPQLQTIYDAFMAEYNEDMSPKQMINLLWKSQWAQTEVDGYCNSYYLPFCTNGQALYDVSGHYVLDIFYEEMDCDTELDADVGFVSRSYMYDKWKEGYTEAQLRRELQKMIDLSNTEYRVSDKYVNSLIREGKWSPNN